MTMNRTNSSCGCKIGRKQAKHGLHSLNEKLTLKREEERASLRDLARFINIQILDSAVSETGVDIVGDISSIFDAITNEDISTERRVIVTDQLRNHGIKVDEVREDFVSYQAVRHHFQNCLGISTERRGVDTVRDARDVLQWSQDRHENIVERTLGRLNRKDVIHLGNPSITSSVTISCEDCGAIYSLDEYLTRGTCGC